MATDNKVNTQLRINESLYERLKAVAEKELRSVNGQIEYFIAKGVEAYEIEELKQNL